MLYHLLLPLRDTYTVFNVFRYITFRTAYATLTALLIGLLIGPWLIRRLREIKIGQSIREEGPASHLSKAGTPTMGGILIVIAVVVPTLLWADLSNRFVWLAVANTVAFAVVGFFDDWAKLRKKRNLGLSGKSKLALQATIALASATCLYMWAADGSFSTQIGVPFFKGLRPDLGLYYVPFAMLLLVGTSNAVNLTDGLDGLAAGASLMASATYCVFAYVAGNYALADHLSIYRVPEAAELTIFLGAMVGATLAFLWFNAHPAEVFMGDTGSLALGGAIGTAALLVKQELLLVLVGGLFVMEALSVAIQVVVFQTMGGKRFFKMAPLHHHFEHLGWPETKVVIRFWILCIIFSLLALSTLKLR